EPPQADGRSSAAERVAERVGQPIVELPALRQSPFGFEERLSGRLLNPILVQIGDQRADEELSAVTQTLCPVDRKVDARGLERPLVDERCLDGVALAGDRMTADHRAIASRVVYRPRRVAHPVRVEA